jgi:hypothetical protein
VRLEEEHGQTRDVWGKGLAEAMKVAGAGVGDTVSLKQVESEPVTVRRGGEGRRLWKGDSLSL